MSSLFALFLAAVSVDVALEVDAGVSLPLRELLVARIAQDGHRIISDDRARAAVVLSVSTSSIAHTISSARGDRTCDVSVVALSDQAIVRLEVAQRASLAVERAALDCAAPARVPFRSTESFVLLSAPRTLALELAARAGGLWRSGGVDPLFAAELSLIHTEGWTLTGALEVSPSSAERLRIVELTGLIGAGYTRRLSSDVSVGAAVLVGGLAHHFRRDASGLHTDMVAVARASSTHAIAAHTAIHLSFSGGFYSGQREHKIGDRVLWSRGAARLVASLGLAHRFDL